ncbi:OmpA family protein [Chlorobium phaeobacteroides]|nr:OmpA family protein [Chlorobium phaeobacteroides]
MNSSIKGVIMFSLMVTAGCSSKNAVNTQDGNAGLSSGQSGWGTTSSSVAQSPSGYGFDEWQKGPLGDVFYDFDSSLLSSEAQEQLTRNSGWMKSNVQAAIIIQGHCDDRGTSEYNLALGDRRAVSAREFLIRTGIASSRIETITFGEERPFSTSQSEEGLAKNRRAHFVIK